MQKTSRWNRKLHFKQLKVLAASFSVHKCSYFVLFCFCTATAQHPSFFCFALFVFSDLSLFHCAQLRWKQNRCTYPQHKAHRPCAVGRQKLKFCSLLWGDRWKVNWAWRWRAAHRSEDPHLGAGWQTLKKKKGRRANNSLAVCRDKCCSAKQSCSRCSARMRCAPDVGVLIPKEGSKVMRALHCFYYSWNPTFPCFHRVVLLCRFSSSSSS